ncbi:MAG: nucleoside triphosphate pyrophosphohydrolase [Vicinamibacterales bacterium]
MAHRVPTARSARPARKTGVRPSTARRRRAARAFDRLVDVMRVLRSPRGCPWDLAQTHESLRRYLLEEAYEALDAIDRADADDLRGELGDVLFQCIFHAQLAADANGFDIADVVEGVTAKLVRRHPHVFAGSGRPLTSAERRRLHLTSPDAVIEQWGRLKAEEQTAAGSQRRVLTGLPRTLPALLRAHTIGSRVASVGFDWPSAPDVVTKIEEEVAELRAALTEGRDRAVDELGDVLFSLANLARKLDIEPEAALSQANDKFTRRFNALEAYLEQRGGDVHAASLAELESAWSIVKAQEQKTRHQPATSAPPTSAPAPRGRRSRR